MPEFRPVPERDVTKFRSMVRYAFRAQEGPTDPEAMDPDDVPEPWKLGDRYGLYDGDDLLTVCKHIPFQRRVRGDFHAVDGLSAVASPPESRRRGYVREMLHGSLAASRENDVYLSALWPFKRSFYAQYGWATCIRAVNHELDPDALAFTRGHRHGEFVVLDADDWERCDAVHDAHGEGYELTLDRTEEWWRKRVFTGWEDDPFVYGWEREAVSGSGATGDLSEGQSESDGELAAYAAYSVDSGDDGGTLTVHDMAWVDHDARLALLRFFADHDSQVETVAFWSSEHDDVLDVVPDPDDGTAELQLGAMFRLEDVPAALEALSYPADVTADLVLEVDDPLAEWNDDTYRLTVEDGSGTVERTGEDPDAELGVGALSQLYVGYRGAQDLATVGELSADDAAVDSLARVLPERKTLLREGF